MAPTLGGRLLYSTLKEANARCNATCIEGDDLCSKSRIAKKIQHGSQSLCAWSIDRLIAHLESNIRCELTSTSWLSHRCITFCYCTARGARKNLANRDDIADPAWIAHGIICLHPVSRVVAILIINFPIDMDFAEPGFGK